MTVLRAMVLRVAVAERLFHSWAMGRILPGAVSLFLAAVLAACSQRPIDTAPATGEARIAAAYSVTRPAPDLYVVRYVSTPFGLSGDASEREPALAKQEQRAYDL